MPIEQQLAPASLVVGIDLGGSRLRVAAATPEGDVLAERDEATTRAGSAALAEQVAGAARAAVEATGSAWDLVGLVAVGVPGVPAGDRLLRAPNLTGDADDLLGRIRVALGAPTTFENDVNLAALAERAHGHARAIGDVAFVSLGTGIGMGAIVDGRLLRGARGGAGEIGDLPYGTDPRSPAAREVGAMEDAAGGAGLARRFAAARPEGPALAARDIYALAGKGDALALRHVEEHAAAVALAIAAVHAVLDCELVVLGGGIGVRDDVRDRVGAALEALVPVAPALRSSALGARAGLLGAVEAARTGVRDPLATGTRP